jgi:Ca2+-dependent lipid-binding protein
MYEAIEARANVLCAGIFFAIVLIGRLFGGSLWGLFPLASVIVSGVFLWMKDLIRRGRDIEWSSEQRRGETAVINLIPESVEWLNTAVGLIWGLINPEMFAAVADTLEVSDAQTKEESYAHEDSYRTSCKPVYLV